MAYGIKRLFILILIASILLLSLVGCARNVDYFKKNRDLFLKENNEIIFNHLLKDKEPDEIEIKSLDVYIFENKFYYHVTYSQISPLTNEWTDMDMVHFGSRQLSNYFNLNWDTWGDMEKHRDAYYAAVEKGEHISFSQEEIRQYVDAFYSSRTNE